MQVKYTVHTRTRLQEMKPETAVVREHEEFLWLHGTLEDNENYAGFIVRFLVENGQKYIKLLQKSSLENNLNRILT